MVYNGRMVLYTPIQRDYVYTMQKPLHPARINTHSARIRTHEERQSKKRIKPMQKCDCLLFDIILSISFYLFTKPITTIKKANSLQILNF